MSLDRSGSANAPDRGARPERRPADASDPEGRTQAEIKAATTSRPPVRVEDTSASRLLRQDEAMRMRAATPVEPKGHRPDRASPGEDALRQQVTAKDRIIAAQQAKLSEQGAQNADLRIQSAALKAEMALLKANEATRDRRNEKLEATVAGLVAKDSARDKLLADLAAQVGELRKERGQHAGAEEANARVDRRTGGGPAADGERQDAQPKRKVASDTAIAFGVSVASGVATTAPDFFHNLSPTETGIGATLLGVGATGFAWVRELRKERKAQANADHRSES